ncbi:MAG TPA: biotin--[acetyl-CoA-carboxylase] ligase [Terriglobales bacterium]|nr:biotin--[acetyl-CoA-carboxylase] ligase [Terriglobales bacterium]
MALDLTAVHVPLRLEPIRAELAVSRLGNRFHYFEQISSTNNRARELAEGSAPEGEVVVAEAQSAGRGRVGRHWVSPAWANLYLSTILRPNLQPAEVPQITLMAAVALADTLESFVPVPPTIKWPNDILVAGKKLAGILTEVSCDAEGVDYVILGMGINLNYPEAMMPDEIRHRATSVLQLTGRPVSRESVLKRLIRDLDRCYGELEDSGFAPLAARWQARFGLRDRRVRVELLDQRIIGVARGIDRDGALLLEDESGARQRIVAGDVVPVET